MLAAAVAASALFAANQSRNKIIAQKIKNTIENNNRLAPYSHHVAAVRAEAAAASAPAVNVRHRRLSLHRPQSSFTTGAVLAAAVAGIAVVVGFVLPAAAIAVVAVAVAVGWPQRIAVVG